MPEIVIVVALACVVGLLAVGAAVLLRARDVLERIVALDLLTVICVALLALLAYLRGVSYYLDAALALSALSFVATLAAVRSDRGGGPFRDDTLLEALGVALVALGIVTIAVTDLRRRADERASTRACRRPRRPRCSAPSRSSPPRSAPATARSSPAPSSSPSSSSSPPRSPPTRSPRRPTGGTEEGQATARRDRHGRSRRRRRLRRLSRRPRADAADGEQQQEVDGEAEDGAELRLVEGEDAADQDRDEQRALEPADRLGQVAAADQHDPADDEQAGDARGGDVGDVDEAQVPEAITRRSRGGRRRGRRRAPAPARRRRGSTAAPRR